jgi:predicted amino acid dehydrogenase
MPAISCSSEALVEAAKCLDSCLPVGLRDAVLIYVLAMNAGVSTDPQSLINAANQIDCGVPKGLRDAVIMSLLCSMAAKAGA